MKFLRILFSIIALLIIVAALALASLIYFVDPNKMKPILATEVLKQTGYQLTIDGPLSWSFYPNLAIKIQQMTLKSPQQATAFIELQDVRVAADLWQLLHGIEKLQGEVTIASTRLMNMRLQDARIGLHWVDEQLILQPMTASLYEGTLTGKVKGRGLSSLSIWNMDVELNHVQLQPLLSDVNGPNSKLSISGLAHVTLQAEARGKDRNQLLGSLNGHSQFSLQDGALQGVDLNYLIQSAVALINKQPMTLTDTNQTAFSSASGDAIIKNGVATTYNAVLIAPTFTTRAQGSVNLLDQSLQLQLQTTPVQGIVIKGNQVAIDIPVLVTGNLQHPEVKLDINELQKFAVKQEIDRLKDKAREKIKEHVPGKAGEFLQNLLGK